ncbi:MAG TPA: T9SS type A sorting domain-containing protein [Bacteroidia bacterium]|jgi:hypothetical protein
MNLKITHYGFKHLRPSLVLLVVILFSGDVFSQSGNYKPFPQVQGEWLVREDGPLASGEIFTWIRYQAFGDTVIGSYTYKKVMGANASDSCSMCAPAVLDFNAPSFRFAYRNDIPDKKVYIYTEIDGVFKDTLWYSFDLNVGDTLHEGYSTRINNGNMMYDRRIIASIDSVSICGSWHKRFHFICNNPFPDLGLIEGIGYEDNFVQTGYESCPFEPVYMYHTDFSCTLTSVKEDKDNLEGLKIFPNPVLKDINISMQNSIFEFPLTYSIVDIPGKVVLSGILTEENSIPVPELNTGMYLLIIKDKKGDSSQHKFVKK